MRYVVIGTSGAGKSIFARRLAQATDSAYIELDELHWGRNWTPKPAGQFEEAVRVEAKGERWVADGNYSAVRHVLWPRATHMVWLNFSRSVVFPRIVWRTIRRTLTRQTLWHGNRESVSTAFFSRDSILLWSFGTYSKNRLNYSRVRQVNEYAHLSWSELTNPEEARKFLAVHGPDHHQKVQFKR